MLEIFFQGVVLKDGKPQANVEVEVELYNEFDLKAQHLTYYSKY